MDKNIKISVIGPKGIPDTQGGIEKFCSKAYPLLLDMGYEITIYTIRRYTDRTQPHYKNIKIVPVYDPSFMGLEKFFYTFMATLLCLFSRPDVVHVHSIASGTFVFILRLFNIKTICFYISQDYLYPKWSRLAKMILKFGEWNFLLSNHIVCNTKGYVDFIKSNYGISHVCYMPGGVDIIEPDITFREEIKKTVNLTDHKFILSVGRLTPEKGFDVLIAAYRRLPEHIKRSHKLLIVGGEDQNNLYGKKLKTMADENIIFTGSLSSDTLECLYKECDLFVLASRYEGMSNVILESIAAKCSILISDIPGNMEFELGEKHYFKSEDIDDLHDKLMTFLADKTLLRVSKEEVCKYLWPSIVERFNIINKDIIRLENGR